MRPTRLDGVLQYVEAQQEHNRTGTFQEKYRELLRKHVLISTRRYVWD
jgi:hypothetical protein